MPIDQQTIDRLARSVQPLVFETGSADFPYSSSRGTAFLVGYQGKPYVLTARHALQPDALAPVCIFPSDTSTRLIPLKDVFFVSQVDADDDSLDIAVIAVDTMRISHPEVAQAALIDTELACGEWESYAEEAQFFILGYPDERATIDPDTLEFRADRVTLFGGRFQVPSATGE